MYTGAKMSDSKLEILVQDIMRSYEQFIPVAIWENSEEKGQRLTQASSCVGSYGPCSIG